MRRFKEIKIILICALLIIHTVKCETDEDFGTEEPEEGNFIILYYSL